MKDSLNTVIRSLIFVVLALMLCAVVFQFAGYNAPVMLWAVLDGAFLRSGAIEQSLRWALPLFITAVASAFPSAPAFSTLAHRASSMSVRFARPSPPRSSRAVRPCSSFRRC